MSLVEYGVLAWPRVQDDMRWIHSRFMSPADLLTDYVYRDLIQVMEAYPLVGPGMKDLLLGLTMEITTDAYRLVDPIFEGLTLEQMRPDSLTTLGWRGTDLIVEIIP